MAKLKPYRINQQLRTNYLNLCVMLAACFTSPEHALGKRRARIPHYSSSALRCIFSPHNATWHFPAWAQILTRCSTSNLRSRLCCSGKGV